MQAKILLASVVALSAFSIGQPATSGAPNVTPPPATAVLKGTVKFEGTAPKSAHINMSADPDCAKLHSSGATTEDVVTDSGGGLENVIVYVSEGLGDRSFDPPQQSAAIEQKGCQYEPHVLAMWANQKLDVLNRDMTTHNIHPIPVNNREFNMAQPPGKSIEVSFSRPEIAIPVKCNVHPWMRSYIAVFKHPYFAVSGKNGVFELDSLPPGDYTIEAWHEKFGTSTQKITVGQNETKEIQFVFKNQAGH